jgi:23S rRNA (cytosine1962-C5)-methyltransferase
MFAADQYQLLDFGEGRKLERFGPYVLDRPAPGTDAFERALDPAEWKQAARYTRTEGDRGKWTYRFPLPSTWEITHGRMVFEIKPTEFGHVGLFPEQATNWDWISTQIERMEPSLKVLNLFAYTGGSTMAASLPGAGVVHIDAAQSTLTWARQNAALSGLSDAPIRWIVEDAEKFVHRELKRGNRYDGVILDPPTYGHGPKGEVWKIEEDLDPLLTSLAELTEGTPKLFLLSCHSPGFSAQVLKRRVFEAFDRTLLPQTVAEELSIEAADGRRLSFGSMVRIVSPPVPTTSIA